MKFLPTTKEEMKSLGWDSIDVLLISGDTYLDTSYNGSALVGKWLVEHGFKVGIIAQPEVDVPDDITRLGEPNLVDGAKLYTKIISAQLLPDEAIFVVSKNTVYIVEKKTQSKGGSVDEKLQTCDFKLKQYKKLFSPLNKEVSYSYLLDKDWFKNPRYKDTLDYIISVGCKYYFNYIPLDAIGLPLPKQEEN